MGESEYITVAEARDILGVSDPKIARIIREGKLAAEENPVDKRSKIIRRAEVLALATKIPPRLRRSRSRSQSSTAAPGKPPGAETPDTTREERTHD